MERKELLESRPDRWRESLRIANTRSCGHSATRTCEFLLPVRVERTHVASSSPVRNCASRTEVSFRTWLSGFAVFALSTSGCQSQSTELRAWRASDHDHVEGVDQQSAGITSETAMPSASEASSAERPVSPHAEGSSQLGQALSTWANHCMRCHGQIGAGDGPNGPQTGARNLTDPGWQARTSDAQIEQTIRSGKGQMPAFQLEPDEVTRLVHLIRQMGASSATP
jgi:mono/diheme cytochrome c family protein